MKSIILMTLLFLSIVLLSCKKEEASSEFPFEAVVLGVNSDCGLFAVKFTGGLREVASLVGTTVGDSIYIAQNLPADLEIDGQKILLDIRLPEPDELSICTSMGPAYSWIYVKAAKKK